MLRHWEDEEAVENDDNNLGKLSTESYSIGFLANRPSSSLYGIIHLKCLFYLFIFKFYLVLGRWKRNLNLEFKES